MAEEAPALTLLAEKVLTSSIKHDSLSYCPTMDLVGLITAEDVVDVYRLNGQKVLSVPARRSCETLKICWKPNGVLLAVAYSDNSISLIATQGGKSVHQIQCPAPTDATVCSVSWLVNFADVNSVRKRLSMQSRSTLDDVLHRGFLGETTKNQANLPRDLAALNIEDILPRLSVLPPGGKEGEMFTTAPSIEALFHSKDAQASASDALLVGFSDGSAYLSVHDFFEVGRFGSKQVFSQSKGPNVLMTVGHPFVPTLGLLLGSNGNPEGELLYFVSLDLKLSNDHGRQFSQLAAKATQMFNVVRYIKECQVQICSEFQTSQNLPHRFIANVEEDLQKDEQCNFTTAAYDLVATGNCSPVMKEWLTDQLTERGQKRWEKAATSGYENARRLIHENLLPALDRLTILSNRLRGMSQFQATAVTFGLETIDIDHMMDSIRCLQLLSHTTLIATDSELRQSTAFCAWLRREIDTQATENANLDELDSEPGLDFADILDFIEGPLQHSVLYELLDIKEEQDTREDTPLPSVGYDLYGDYKNALRVVRNGSRPKSRLPGMQVLISRLQDQCGLLFEGVADTQRKKIKFGDPELIGQFDLRTLHARMVPTADGAGYICYIAAITPDKLRVVLTSIEVSLSRGVSSLSRKTHGYLTTSAAIKLIDAKFVDDQSMMILTDAEDTCDLFAVRYRAIDGSESDVQYHISDHHQKADTEAPLLLDAVESEDSFLRHRFDKGVPPFSPMRLEINGRKGRRVICVVADDLIQYRVFDLDSAEEEQSETGMGANDRGADDDDFMSS